MQFNKTKLEGAYVIELERREDSRGFFARAFCQKEFADHGLKPLIAQANVAYNFKKGTLRGMHFQFPPAAETKLVRCTRGAILDIVVDLRPESPTYLQNIAVELNEENGRALYVPERFAHGYQTLRDNTETSYQVGEFYAPDYESGLMHDDPRLGLTPRVMGNIKGLQDPYRNPSTQKGFAEKWGQNPAMVTSFADGSKISFEQAIVANATGMVVKSRGMSRGAEYRDDVMKIGKLYDIEELRRLGGIVDYVVGTPLTKIYCLAEHPDPKQQHYLNLYKMGDGPLYSFFLPYHLVHFEVPNAIARVALLRDSVARPLRGPVVEVCAVAKRDLKADEVLDDYGMYMTYGEAVNADEMSNNRYLPEGLVEGCKLRRDIAKDAVLTYDDVKLPRGRLADQLRAQQYRHFRGETWLEQLTTR